ncbi:MAG: S9 family peptidase [Thermaerobacter sp.]|nr:S9 family peptidase [Thermaerobacter sp.]
MQPPIARREPHTHQLHGDARTDEYHWLRRRDNPEVIAYLEAENRYRDSVLQPLSPLVERIYEEMLARIQEDKVDVPAQDGPYFYYSRTVKGLQYRIHARKLAQTRMELDLAPEEVILDLNGLAEGSGFFNVTLLRLSPDHNRLAYLENRDGTDRYTLRVKDLRTGEFLPDEIPDVFLVGSLEWDASGTHLFYVTVDDTQRPYRLWRHRLGDLGGDVLLAEEHDVTFSFTLGKSRSGRHLFLNSESKTTSEVRVLAADAPTGEWSLFRPRVEGIEYYLEDWGDDFLILTNEDAENFRLMACPVTDPRHEAWRSLIPYDPAIYLQGIHPFAGALIVAGRQDGLSQLWVLSAGELRRLSWSEPVYSVDVWRNREYGAKSALIAYESRVTPETIYELDLLSLKLTLLRQDEIPGGYDPAQYRQERIWANAEDGTRVPMSAVYRAGARDGGPAPLLLHGYGSYGMSTEPGFNPMLLTLLDRGVVVVAAHVRGGSEMGRHWYEDGKLLRKRNTFTDFVACAKELVQYGWTTPELLAASGRSAGGLLMGAIVNLAPELFKVVSAGVPFVDVVTTMLDASIPLTTLEWDEWGNPAAPEYYGYMKSYSPYDNVEAKAYPHLYVFTGLNDPRVAFWEPVKWVARLRATKTDAHQLVLKTLMGAGHGGSSGRYARLREFAEEYAFLLHHIGIDA